MKIVNYALLAMASLTFSGLSHAQDSLGAPRPTPMTRPLLKLWLEDVKQRQPRIPLPELTPEDRQALGEQSENYESRLRYHYLNGIEVQRPFVAQSAPRTGRTREQDPNYTLDNGFKVELFWIVSRVNNCHYCIGHQESKLLGAGRSEDEIASLDGDWSEQPLEKQVAFRFAKRFTYEPHLLCDADIRELQQYYSDSQILEMILSMSGNNSINRWKEAVAVPQRADEGGYSRIASLSDAGDFDPSLPRGSYLTPTSRKFETAFSLAVPVNGRIDKELGLAQTASKRPALESSQCVLENLRSAAKREPRLPLLDHQATLSALPHSASFGDKLPNWVRLLAHFPVAGASRLESISAAEKGGDLSPTLKGQLAWIVARQDRAWYAAGQSLRQLRSLGIAESDVLKLDGSWESYTARERALFQLARNLAASPVVLTSAEIAQAVEHAGARDTVQAISYVCSRTSFNRLTEAAGLPLEPESSSDTPN
jgi:alkylhydroperoxidase family enzyme